MYRIPVNFSRIHLSFRIFSCMSHSTTTSSFGPRSMFKLRDINRTDRTIFKRNVIHSALPKRGNQVVDIKFDPNENLIKIDFNDGKTGAFNSTWLRDSCPCAQCVHPLTQTKLINSAGICAKGLFIEQIHCTDDSIVINWINAKNEQHISHYSINWLKMFNNLFDNKNIVSNGPNDGLYTPGIPLPERILWESAQINRPIMTQTYENFMNLDDTLRIFLTHFCQFGFAFLGGVPTEKKAILSVARRIAYERQTSFGSTFEVAFIPDTNAHLAYTGASLGAHTDLPYRERSPGVQILHCIEQASEGGASILVDGIRCAEELRGSHLDLFHILTEYPVLFSLCDKEKGLWFRGMWPIIGLNPDSSVKEIHYNHLAMRAPILPLHVLDRFYDAHRKLTELLKSERFEYRYNLSPGDLVFFNNRRLLHGRDEFDHVCQKRLLIGCYMDSDEVIALYEKLSK